MKPTPEQFLQWRRSFQDQLRIERTLLPMLGGSLVAACILSRLLDFQTGALPGPIPVTRRGKLYWPLTMTFWTEHLHVGESTVRRALRKLEKAGYVQTRREAKPGGGTQLLWALDLGTLVKGWHV